MDHGGSYAFAVKVLDGLRATPFARVAVACGKSVEAAVEALQQAAFAKDHAPVLMDIVAFRQTADFFHELSVCMGCAAVTDAEGLVAEMAGFCQPRLVTLVGLIDETLMPAIIQAARLVADVTRDLPAPIRFVWLHDAAQTGLEVTIPYEVWPAEWRDIPQIEFHGGLNTVLYRALRYYLDRRVYWESAGQSDRIRELDDRIGLHGFSPASVMIDESLEQIFDLAPIADTDRLVAAECLAESAHIGLWLKGLRQNISPAMEEASIIRRWNAIGIVWRPPGVSRERITPLCIRVLAENAGHPITAELGQDLVRSRMIYARANPQIAQMTLVLTTQIEAELLDALRRVNHWEALMDTCEIKSEVKKNQERSISCQAYFFEPSDCLLEYATFGQLVRMAQAAGAAFRFPLSREMLWEIVNVRNLAAHGHSVRWNGLRRVVEAVFALGA